MNNGILSGFTRGGISPLVYNTFYPTMLTAMSGLDTANFVWTRPPNVQVVEFFVVGAGGGGGSGRKGAAATARVGGAGGGGGGFTRVTYFADDLPQQVQIAVGVGGIGGNPVSANDTDGNSGSGGNSTRVGGRHNQSSFILAYAYGGGGGPGGGSSSFRSGVLAYDAGSGGEGQIPGGQGGICAWDCSSVTGGSDGSQVGFPGGGGGGGITAADATMAGGAGSISVWTGTVKAEGGAAATAGEHGFSFGATNDASNNNIGVLPFRSGMPSPATGSSGGGGGSSTSATAAGRGGDARSVGAGGGGGGAALNTTTPHSGGGGAGGHGLVVVTGWG